ncbi:MAG: Card1-like endonuclease domain-containing protein [Limisphaerales bacterium]|jgi:hypothetical protein
MKTQLCLLGGELMPNVIGILHQQPDVVLPVVTRESAKQVEHLATALRAAGCPARLQDPITVLPYDPADCWQSLRQNLRASDHLTINWTGGTKIMSFAARRFAEALKLSALYVNTAERQLLTEDLATGTTRVDSIDSTRLGLNVLVHILAAGHRLEGASDLEAFRHRCTPSPALVRAATLIMDARPWERTELFRLADAANQPRTPTRLGEGFLQALVDARLIQPGRRPGEFFLSTETLLHPFHRQSAQEQNAAFLRSLYLEVFVWSQIKERSALDDVAWHLVLNPGQTGRMAELDVVAAGEGRLLVLECKSHLDLDKLADVIEEQFARTRRIGRLFGSWMLYIHRHRADYVAANAAAIIASQEAKAREYGGCLVWHDDLADLPLRVATFINESRPIL